jgi:hypothetical protein
MSTTRVLPVVELVPPGHGISKTYCGRSAACARIESCAHIIQLILISLIVPIIPALSRMALTIYGSIVSGIHSTD